MRVRILGSAAGGGLPQWNCGCANCAAVRAGSAYVLPRTQSSVAVRAKGQGWLLLNVSPDIRQQILACPELGPAANEARGTRIAGCVLTDAELDHTAGLLLLREGCEFGINSTPLVRSWLNRCLPVEPILNQFAVRPWTNLELNVPRESAGLRIRAFEVDRHIPKFVGDCPIENAVGSVIGLHITDPRTGGSLLYAPCVGSLSEPLRAAAAQADCVLLDGTFWTDDELMRLGIGTRTARQMGHLPVSGADGSLPWLATLPAAQRVYVHINNTNPMLNRQSVEYGAVVENGVRVGVDGDVFDL